MHFIHGLIIDVVAKHISLNLAEKSAQHMLDLKALAEDCNIQNPLPSNIIVLEQANQLRGMITIIQDRDSEKGDFIFYLERISSIVLERYILSCVAVLRLVRWTNYRIH
jgi:uridine kinase